MSFQPAPATFPEANCPVAPGRLAFHHNPSAYQFDPSLPNHFEGQNMGTSLDSTRRNFQRRNGKTFRERFSTRDVTHAVSGVLGDFQAKEIADASGSSVRAAENAKQGMNAMSLAHFLNACREIPELRALAMEMMGCETTINPDRERALAMLVNSFVRREG